LRDRIGPIDQGSPVEAGAGVAPVAPWKDQLLHALAGLGFSGREAAEAVELVAETAPETPDVPAMLRRSIQLLGRTT
jgi:Holliday junction DNA helicase RuvA